MMTFIRIFSRKRIRKKKTNNLKDLKSLDFNIENANMCFNLLNEDAEDVDCCVILSHVCNAICFQKRILH